MPIPPARRMRRRISAAVPVALVVALGSVVGAPGARAATTGAPLIGLGKCADDANWSTADGNPIVLWSCNGGANQSWSFPGDGTVRVLAKCLTVAGGTAGSPNGTPIELRTCSGSGSQSWTSSNGNLINTLTGKCLDINASDATKPLEIWTCGGHQPNQTWAQAGSSRQSFSYHGYAADDPNAVTASPGTGFRQELFVNAKDLTNPFPTSNPEVTDTSGRVDVTGTIARNAQTYGGSTRVVQVYFYLYDYAKTDIPAAAISNMQAVFDALRGLGYKAVLRFAIDDGVRSQQCYTVQDLQRLIGQVQPLLSTNADLVALWEAGLVGAWGEWGPNCYNHQNYAGAVNAILTSELRALPAGVPFAVRYPWLKDDVSDTTLRAEIGYHNDFLTVTSSSYDYYLPTSSSWNEVVAAAPSVGVDGEMPYDKGESTDPNAWSTPINGLAAARRLQSMHYSTLSIMHNHTVTLPAWKQDFLTASQVSGAGLPAESSYFTNANGSAASRTAFDYIRDHLGHRLRLTGATIGSASSSPAAVPVTLSLVNDGFSAPHANATVHLVVLDGAGNIVRDKATTADWRSWQGIASSETTTGSTQSVYTVSDTVDMSTLPSGAYRIAVWIPTGTAAGGNGPGYDVRFADNDTAWVTTAATGVNVLGTVAV